MAQEPGFFDQRNPKTDEPAERILGLSPRTVITVDGVQYRVTRGAELHVTEVVEEQVQTQGIVPDVTDEKLG